MILHKLSNSFSHYGLLALLLLSVACGKPKKGVKVEEAEIRDVYARVTESGVIQPTVEVPVAPDVSGEVVAIAVQEGIKVKKGDLLMTIRPDDYKAQLEQAQAALNRSQAAYLQAKANAEQSRATLLQDSVALKRTEQLFKEQVVSQVDLENAQLRFNVSKSQYEASRFNVQSSYYSVRSAEASKKQARQNLDRTNIYASMDGTITLLTAEVGQRVVGTGMMSGSEILKIADLSSMEVVVEINENDIINVGLGDSALVEVDAFPDEKFYGQVTEIAYSATVAGVASTDQVTNFEVKVKVDPASYRNRGLAPGNELNPSNESPFRPGMSSLVEIYTRNSKGVITVPIQAVTLRQPKDDEDADPEEVIFRFNDGRAERINVLTGIADDKYIEIAEGLDEGDQIIVGPYSMLTKMLKDSMEVRIRKNRGENTEEEEEG
ncbi:MAG: efflux RND transporter periplasmic adaptor subunit [Bacteroidota bacterium]